MLIMKSCTEPHFEAGTLDMKLLWELKKKAVRLGRRALNRTATA